MLYQDFYALSNKRGHAHTLFAQKTWWVPQSGDHKYATSFREFATSYRLDNRNLFLVCLFLFTGRFSPVAIRREREFLRVWVSKTFLVLDCRLQNP
jgi:hypothetical protein